MKFRGPAAHPNRRQKPMSYLWLDRKCKDSLPFAPLARRLQRKLNFFIL
jgi:hypothetical protein